MNYLHSCGMLCCLEWRKHIPFISRKFTDSNTTKCKTFERVCIYFIFTGDRQTDRYTGRQTDKRVDRQTERRVDRQKDR